MLKKLKTLLAIADTGSFNAAADRMFITQSAVSMQMKGLEETLHLELFDRSVRPPRLNNTGRLLLDQARQIVKLSDDLIDVSPVASQFKGSIKLGSIPGAAFILPETLFRLNNTYRYLQIMVSSNLSESLASDVTHERLDAALVTQLSETNPRLRSRPILREPMFVLASRAQAGQSDTQLLENNRYISYNRKAEVSRIIEEAFRQRNITVDPIMELDTLETFQMMIVKGLGVGILPLSSIRLHLMDKFYKVPFGSPTLTRNLVLIQPNEHNRQAILDALYETFCAVASDVKTGV